jgi:hypothetical protein
MISESLFPDKEKAFLQSCRRAEIAAQYNPLFREEKNSSRSSPASSCDRFIRGDHSDLFRYFASLRGLLRQHIRRILLVV